MEEYLAKFNNIEFVKEELLSIYNVDSQIKLSEAIGIGDVTLSRIFSSKIGKGGRNIVTVEKIVRAIVEHREVDEGAVRKKIYELIYSPDIVDKKLQEAVIFQRTDAGNKVVTNNEAGSDMCSEEDSLAIKLEEKDGHLKQIKDAIENIAMECSLDIEECKISERNDSSIIAYVKPGYNSIFMEAYIGMIYGVYLTEKNYDAMIHNVAELNTEDGIIILFYEEESVFSKAWRDEKLKVENNVLLYCLSEKRKICVRSTRKQQKRFLKNLFGKEKLLFAEK